MKVAVLYTGEIRTLEKTTPFFRKHILNSTNADIFATLQGTISCDKFENIVKYDFQDNLKSLHWFSREEYKLQDHLINAMQLTPEWKNYLKNSGSMIEYYQLYLSFMKMREYEDVNGFKYDYVIRLRTDVVITRSFDFAWTQWSNEELKKHWNNVEEKIKGVDVDVDVAKTSKMSIVHFFHSFLSLKKVISPDIVDIIEMNDGEFFSKDNLKDAIQRKWLITVRKNVFYCGTRNAFADISRLGITYGLNKLEKYEHWFDAESQLQTICEKNRISVFDMTTKLEGESLYQYNRQHYFDDKNQLLENDSVFCFICRN